MKKNRLSLMLAFAVIAVEIIQAQTNNSEQTIIVGTEAGKVQGMIINGISVFKNVPYAAPPVGNLRFAAPAKPLPWDGMRDAIKSGPTPPNPKPKAGDIDDKPTSGNGWVKGDDFLTANVWTPDVKGTRLPVMVYVYGFGKWFSYCYFISINNYFTAKTVTTGIAAQFVSS